MICHINTEVMTTRPVISRGGTHPPPHRRGITERRNMYTESNIRFLKHLTTFVSGGHSAS